MVVLVNLSILDVDRGGACFHGTARAGQFLIGLAAIRCADSAFRATASEFVGIKKARPLALFVSDDEFRV